MQYLEEQRAKVKDADEGLLKYTRHLEAKLKELYLENQNLKQELDKIKKRIK